MKTRPVLSAVLAAMALGCASAPTSASSEADASSFELRFDGSFDEAAWRECGTVSLRDEAELRFLVRPDRLIFGVRPGAYPARYVDLYFRLRSGDTLNLHASRKLGERVLSGRDWTDREPPFAWSEAPRGWRGNIAEVRPDADPDAPFETRMLPMDGYELEVTRERLGDPPWRVFVEVSDFAGGRDPIIYPADGHRHKPAAWWTIPTF